MPFHLRGSQSTRDMRKVAGVSRMGSRYSSDISPRTLELIIRIDMRKYIAFSRTRALAFVAVACVVVVLLP